MKNGRELETAYKNQCRAIIESEFEVIFLAIDRLRTFKTAAFDKGQDLLLDLEGLALNAEEVMTRGLGATKVPVTIYEGMGYDEK